ncbi:MAG: DDE-type integrase/transposase/recombinase [Candidatus Aminicenantaceae bacterium]
MERKSQFSQKQKLDILGSAKDVGIKESSDVVGVHYSTVYQWQRKLNVLGEEAFLAYRPKSRGRGIKKVTEQQEKAVRKTWKRYPGFGPSQVRNQLRRQGITISTKTVQKIMEANGYRGIRKKRDKKESQRFEATRPLELVQIDILEFFIHKLKVYLLLLLDDFSRFILGFRLSTETSIDLVIGLFQKAMDRYGKMEEVLSDRGFVFYSWRGINRFEQYLEVEGIHQTHASPHHPQTLGKIEAANKQIQKELIRRQEFKGVEDAEEAIKKWVEIHNYKRTHQGLGGLLVPADRFHGRVDAVLEALSKKIDPETQIGYDGIDISRSLMNLVLEPAGRVRLYVLGHPVDLFWRQP